MILRTVRKLSLVESAGKRRDLEFWLSRTPEERLAAVDRLRNEWHGGGASLQSVARIIQRSSAGGSS